MDDEHFKYNTQSVVFEQCNYTSNIIKFIENNTEIAKEIAEIQSKVN